VDSVREKHAEDLFAAQRIRSHSGERNSASSFHKWALAGPLNSLQLLIQGADALELFHVDFTVVEHVGGGAAIQSQSRASSSTQIRISILFSNGPASPHQMPAP
jgi:hypothetical protein